jgi:hypothetical protein
MARQRAITPSTIAEVDTMPDSTRSFNYGLNHDSIGVRVAGRGARRFLHAERDPSVGDEGVERPLKWTHRPA